MVECRGALRKRSSRGSAGNGTLAEPLDGGRMEGTSRCRGIGQRCGGGAAIHAYRKAARVRRICCQPGTFHSSGAGSAEGRQAYEGRTGCQAGWLYLRCMRNRASPVCRIVVPALFRLSPHCLSLLAKHARNGAPGRLFRQHDHVFRRQDAMRRSRSLRHACSGHRKHPQLPRCVADCV